MTGFDISTAQGIYLGGNQVQSLYLGSTKIWPTTHDYSQDYLTIVSTSNNNVIGWKGSHSGKTIQVSTDEGQIWTSYTSSRNVDLPIATLNNGDRLLIKGNETTYGKSNRSVCFTSTGSFNVEGNIMSLLYGDNFIGQTTLPNEAYIFKQLFENTNIINAEHLILPATTLMVGCYGYMFNGCTSLTYAPALPATTLEDGCYMYMFNGCTSLIAAPILPATTLVDNCYQGMFYNCSSLTTAPELPATTLATTCYAYIFRGCSLLNYIKCLATDISAQNCTANWTTDVGATGTFVKDANMTSWTTGDNGIPSGWTVIDAN